MPKALPRKWFPDRYQATIRLRKVDGWAVFNMGSAPYFDSWEEAHAYQQGHAKKRLADAERDLKSAKRYAEKVAGLQPNAGVKPGRRCE